MTALIALVLAQAASTDDPGYQQLVNGAAVTCGMPLVLWSQVTPKATPSFAGRLGPNATLDDSYTAVRAPAASTSSRPTASSAMPAASWERRCWAWATAS
jgi:hypothetical protein